LYKYKTLILNAQALVISELHPSQRLIEPNPKDIYLAKIDAPEFKLSDMS
jgi:hypothetical protein